MTQTLTIERLQSLLDELKSWQYGYDPADDKEQYDMLAAAELAVIQLLANREARPVAFLSKGDVDTSQPHILAKKYRSLACTLPVFTAPPAPAVPDDVHHLKNVQELYHRQEDRLFELAQRIKGASFDKYSHTTAQAIDVLEREIFGDDDNACRAAMLAAAPEGGK